MDNIYSIIGQLPNELKSCFMVFDNVLLSNITEIRLRINKPIIIYILDKPYFISKYDKLINHYTDSVRYLSGDEFKFILDNICNNSYHTHINTMINGYVTDNYGSRVGIAGEAVYKDSALTSVKNIESLNIRISHNIIDCSRNIIFLLRIV